MAMQDQDFWRSTVPGMFDVAGSLYGMHAGQSEANKRIAAAQGPAYQQAQRASSVALANAGNMDPRAAAQERFNMQQGLLAGKDQADEAALWRDLYNKGMLGAASYNPGVEGITPTGTAMNPQMAAFYAARNARNAKSAYDAMNFGEEQIDRQVNRAATLQNQANAAQNAGVQVQRLRPSKAAAGQQLLSGVGRVLKNPGVISDIGGMLGRGADWLGSITGWWDTGPELLNWWE